MSTRLTLKRPLADTGLKKRQTLLPLGRGPSANALAAHPTLPVLLVSGSHSESAASFPFLHKPFTQALLLDALRGMLAARRVVLPRRQSCR
jgi:hypothetical protein